MTKRIFFLLFSFLLIGVTKAQLSPEEMEGIDRLCNDFRKNASSYKKVEKFRDSSGTRDVFMEGAVLKFVRAHAIDKVGVDKIVEWFFVNGKMIYCEQIWTFTESKKIFNNEKLYLKNGQLAMWIKTGGKPTDPNSPEFKETNFYLTEYAKTLYNEATQ